jgi:hypothetical protein
MFRWLASRERSDFKRARDFLDSSRIVMSIAIETRRCIDEFSIACTEQQVPLLTTVALNARFLNKNLDVAVNRFTAWERRLVDEQPEHLNRIRCMIMNARRNFDAALMHFEEFNEWLQDDMH